MLALHRLPRSVCPIPSRISSHHMLSIQCVLSLLSSTPHPLYSLSVHPCLVYGSLPRPSCGLRFSNRLFLLFPTWMSLTLRDAVQFVGGDTARDCLPSIRKLRAKNKGALLAYSVEADANEIADGARTSRPSGGTPHIVQEMIRAIELAADYEDSQIREDLSSGRRTWVAVKLVSKHPVIVISYKSVSRRGHPFRHNRALSYPTRPRWSASRRIFPRFTRATLHRSPVAHAQMTWRSSS
jgi:hypothetical protein